MAQPCYAFFMQYLNLHKHEKSRRLSCSSSGRGSKPLHLGFRSWALRIFAAVLMSSLVIFGVIASHINWRSLDKLARDLPTVDLSDDVVVLLKDSEQRPLQSRDLARDSKLNLDMLPKYVMDAFIAAEDASFFEHYGIDPIAIFRALIANIQSFRFAQGASTITQQVARISYLTPDKKLWRKINEMILAVLIERHHSKKIILTRYLHHIYLGQSAFGVEEAAWVYFGKKPDKLSLGEAALIAGLAPAPSRYNPFTDEITALKRRDLVLQRMVKSKAISKKQAKLAKDERLIFARKKPHLDPAFAFLQQQVLKEVKGSLAISNEQAKHLRIVTSIDVNWQRSASKWDGFIGHHFGSACGEDCESAFVAIDAKSGHLLGFTGSGDFRKSQFNRVIKMERSMGQMILPFVVGSSFENGGNWLQTFGVRLNHRSNENSQQQVEPTLMDALRGRLHAESMRLMYLNGMGTWQHFLNRFSQLWETSWMNAALGMETVSPIGMARLYAGLLTAHEFGEMAVVRKVADPQGRTLFERSQEVAPEVVSSQQRHMLREGLREHFALAAKDARKRMGSYSGYIGFSPNNHDLWAVFATHDVVAVGWFGVERGKRKLMQEYLSQKDYRTIDRIWLSFAELLPRSIEQKNIQESINSASRISMVPYRTIWGESMRVPAVARLSSQSEQSLGAEIIYR